MTVASFLRRIAWKVWSRVKPPRYTVESVEEHPSTHFIERNVVYVVKSGRALKWAYFRCPCDRHDVIRLGLMKSQQPHWEVSVDRLGKPTVTPSVRQVEGCYSHFWIRSGRVAWCSDSGKPFDTFHRADTRRRNSKVTVSNGHS